MARHRSVASRMFAGCSCTRPAEVGRWRVGWVVASGTTGPPRTPHETSSAAMRLEALRARWTGHARRPSPCRWRGPGDRRRRFRPAHAGGSPLRRSPRRPACRWRRCPRLLNGKPDVSARTHALVRQALLTSGYRKRANDDAPPLIDIVFNDFDSPWAIEIDAGGRRRGPSGGADGRVHGAVGGGRARVWFDHITSRGTRGIILRSSSRSARRQCSLPAVCRSLWSTHGRARSGGELGRRGNWSGGLTATKYLIDLGIADRDHHRPSGTPVQPSAPRRLPRRPGKGRPLGGQRDRETGRLPGADRVRAGEGAVRPGRVPDP